MSGKGKVMFALGLGAIALMLGIADLWGRSVLHKIYHIDVPELPRGDASRGSGLARHVLACTECHGSDFGGKVVVEGAFIGRISAANLTPLSTEVSEYSDADWDRAIRHGVDRHGQALVLMPSESYALLTDQDTADVIAYLRSLSGVPRKVARTNLGLAGRQLAVWGALPLAATAIDHARVDDSGAGSPSRGEYLAQISGCSGCHGTKFEGRTMGPGTPNASPLNPQALATWTLDEFALAVRGGIGKDGRKLAPIMPYRSMAGMSDDDVASIFAFLKQGVTDN